MKALTVNSDASASHPTRATDWSGAGSFDATSFHTASSRRGRSLRATFRFSRFSFAAIRSTAAILGILALALFVVLDATGLSAQQGPGASLASQSMRPYAHVFWAYALAWALVLGWVISLGRRWSRVEEDLEQRSGSE